MNHGREGRACDTMPLCWHPTAALLNMAHPPSHPVPTLTVVAPLTQPSGGQLEHSLWAWGQYGIPVCAFSPLWAVAGWLFHSGNQLAMGCRTEKGSRTLLVVDVCVALCMCGTTRCWIEWIRLLPLFLPTATLLQHLESH